MAARRRPHSALRAPIAHSPVAATRYNTASLRNRPRSASAVPKRLANSTSVVRLSNLTDIPDDNALLPTLSPRLSGTPRTTPLPITAGAMVASTCMRELEPVQIVAEPSVTTKIRRRRSKSPSKSKRGTRKSGQRRAALQQQRRKSSPASRRRSRPATAGVTRAVARPSTFWQLFDQSNTRGKAAGHAKAATRGAKVQQQPRWSTIASLAAPSTKRRQVRRRPHTATVRRRKPGSTAAAHSSSRNSHKSKKSKKQKKRTMKKSAVKKKKRGAPATRIHKRSSDDDSSNNSSESSSDATSNSSNDESSSAEEEEEEADHPNTHLTHPLGVADSVLTLGSHSDWMLAAPRPSVEAGTQTLLEEAPASPETATAPGPQQLGTTSDVEVQTEAQFDMADLLQRQQRRQQQQRRLRYQHALAGGAPVQGGGLGSTSRPATAPQPRRSKSRRRRRRYAPDKHRPGARTGGVASSMWWQGDLLQPWQGTQGSRQLFGSTVQWLQEAVATAHRKAVRRRRKLKAVCARSGRRSKRRRSKDAAPATEAGAAVDVSDAEGVDSGDSAPHAAANGVNEAGTDVSHHVVDAAGSATVDEVHGAPASPHQASDQEVADTGGIAADTEEGATSTQPVQPLQPQQQQQPPQHEFGVSSGPASSALPPAHDDVDHTIAPLRPQSPRQVTFFDDLPTSPQSPASSSASPSDSDEQPIQHNHEEHLQPLGPMPPHMHSLDAGSSSVVTFVGMVPPEPAATTSPPPTTTTAAAASRSSSPTRAPSLTFHFANNPVPAPAPAPLNPQRGQGPTRRRSRRHRQRPHWSAALTPVAFMPTIGLTMASVTRRDRRAVATVTTLQSVWRGRRVRGTMARLRAGAIALQRVARGWHTRVIVRRLREDTTNIRARFAAARTLERFWVAAQAPRAARRRRLAATGLQAVWRGMCVRYDSELVVLSVSLTCCTHVIHHTALRQRHELHHRRTAVMVLQQWMKLLLAYRALARAHSSLLDTLQAACGALLRLQHLQNGAATMIQAAWQGWVARDRMAHMHYSASVIQVCGTVVCTHQRAGVTLYATPTTITDRGVCTLGPSHSAPQATVWCSRTATHHPWWAAASQAETQACSYLHPGSRTRTAGTRRGSRTPSRAA